ncbi:MAG: hypothetical protein LBM72_02145, partial [Mycoplasmataceae bacterium]|nr:hypothetical protein [Mycoplasmataceae bacterium]
MLNNTRFYAQKQYAFTMNNNFLHDLYAPILGHDAINLYTILIHEADKQALFMGIATEMNDFFKAAGVDYTDFVKARTKLEALGLLTTYLKNDTYTNISTYSFILNEPLKFVDFITNQKYRHLLIQQIGQVNYEKLEFCYAANRVPADAENVTVTIDSVFNDEQINKVTTMNFDNLYKNIAASTS